jgi:hypothetical protein
MLLETNFRVSNLKFSCLPALAATASYSMLTAGASRACFTPAPTYFVFAAGVGTPAKPRLRAAIFAVATQHKKWRSGSRQAIRRSSSAVLADSSHFAGDYLRNARNMIDRLAENRPYSGGKPNKNRKDERFSTVSLGRFAVGCRSRSK